MNKPINLDFSLTPLGVQADPENGRVSLANEQSMASTFLSQALTEYAVGYRSDQALEDLLQMLAPEVPVSRRFSYKKFDNAESFALESDGSDVRALNSRFKIVSNSSSIVEAKTYSKGFTTVIDLDEEDEDTMVEERKVAHLKRLLLRAEIIRAKGLLAVGSATTKWSAGTGVSNPDADLATAIIAAANGAGLTPNRIVMDDGAWAARFANLLAATNSATGAMAMLTPEQLAAILGVDKIYISRDRITAGTARNNILGAKKVYLFNANDGADREDPSNIKRFVSSSGGQRWGVYRRDVGSRLVEITVCHWSNLALTSSEGVGYFSVT